MSTSPNWKALNLYVKYCLRFPWLTFGSVLFSLILALRDTIVPLVIAFTLGQLIHEHTINVGLLVFAALFQVALVGLGWLLDYVFVAGVHLAVQQKLYTDAFEYMVHQDYSFFTNQFGGSLVNQASRFAKSFSTFHDVVFFNFLPQVISVLISVGIMTYYDPMIGLATLAMWVFSEYVVVLLSLKRLPIRRAAVAKESQQVGELADIITNSLTVKTFASEDSEIKRYHATNELRGSLFLRAWQRAILNGWVIEFLCVLLQMVVFVGGIVAVHRGSLDIAIFLLFQVYILRIIDSVRRSTMQVRNLEVVSGDAEEMTELLEQAPLIQDRLDTAKSTIAEGRIDISDMSFRYDDTANSTKPLFEDFDLQIESGKRIGLVGPSGGGKTTITRLLLRFMDIQNGSIKIDGQDIRDIKQQDLRSAIAYVPQEPLLFHRTIKENIKYGRPSASDDDVIEVAKKSFAHDFIKELPKGYDTLVGERGVKLSGGQRQRVAIARAMLKNAPILILDEATSALDSESERVIQKALWELMKDKTAVVIAHRLSTIQRMDRIVVLDEGRIVEQGTHKELIKQSGLYAKLWSHQSGGFIEE